MSVIAFLCVTILVFIQGSNPCVYQNPVYPSGADPWVTHAPDGDYLFTHTVDGGRSIYITATKLLQDLSRARVLFHYVPDPTNSTGHSANLWAPEVHFLQGKWYIYFAAGSGSFPTQRMHVLQGGATPEQPFHYLAKLNLPDDQYSIDGTILKLGDELYFVWSGWPNPSDRVQNLYIARMKNPWTIESAKRVLISTPQHAWETVSGRINEGPEQLTAPDGTNYIIYSATGSASDNYCLGLLHLVDQKRPLDPRSWQKHPKPVFSKTDKVFGPGHCSFVKSPSGREWWIVYHSAKCKGCGWNRWIDIQRFGFDWLGHWPELGKPVPPHTNLTCPK